MKPADEVRMKLDCGASVILTVRVDRRGCMQGGAECPTAADVAGMIWLSLKEEEQWTQTD